MAELHAPTGESKNTGALCIGTEASFRRAINSCIERDGYLDRRSSCFALGGAPKRRLDGQRDVTEASRKQAINREDRADRHSRSDGDVAVVGKHT